MKLELQRSTKVLLSTSAAGVLLLAAAAPALGHQSNSRAGANVDSEVNVDSSSSSRGGLLNLFSDFNASLDALNGSGDSGDVSIDTHSGRRVTVRVETEGVSPNLPHAQHIHIGGRNECPTRGDDQDNDGFISTAEGQPAYGPVAVTLTTKGDVSADSALAVSRFPVADQNGEIDYERTFTLPEGVDANDLRNGVVVQHGISAIFGDALAFDGDRPASLDDSLPFEAVVPASCGELSQGLLSGGLNLNLGSDSRSDSSSDSRSDSSSDGLLGSDSDSNSRSNSSGGGLLGL